MGEVIKESVARVRKLIQEAEGKGKPMGTEKFFDEVRMIQIQNSFSYKLRLYVVLEGCFGDDMVPKTLKAKMPYVKKMVRTPPRSRSWTGSPRRTRSLSRARKTGPTSRSTT